MVILGFNGGVKFEHEDAVGIRAHDAAAVLIRDGEVLAAIEEERLSRVKHTNVFPARAIRWCLDTAGIDWRDVDRVATNTSPSRTGRLAIDEFLNDPTRQRLDDEAAFVNGFFARAFGVDVRDRVRLCHHHVAHAWSAFVPSGFDRSLIVSLDGSGDDRSGMVFMGHGGRIEVLREFAVDQSLGHMYVELIRQLGYRRFDEYKVMGLAPYGDPRVYGPLLETFVELLPNGDYRLPRRGEMIARLHEAGLIARARRKGEPFGQGHIDFAAAVQAMLERIVFHVVSHFREATRERHLCLAGGVAHNCTLNGKLLTADLFDRVFVQPAADDAGGALGAAWWAHHDARQAMPRPSFRHLYFGSEIGRPDTIRAELHRWRELIAFEAVEDVTRRAAHLMANGAIVAWTQGRSEFGPRALGNRSILADPRPAAHKQVINDLVKKREAFRPFAPSVLVERASEYFDLANGAGDLPFMIFIVPVVESWRARLGAITHVDGTARVQTVSRDVNPMFWQVIREFERLTGVAILLNTSFNNDAEPIVDSARDAIVSFLTTSLEYLVVGDFLVTKRTVDERRSAYRTLAPDLPVSRKLVKRRRFDGAGYAYQIESGRSREFGPPEVTISDELFDVLQRLDGVTPLSTLLHHAGVSGEAATAAVVTECVDLWSRRMLVLRPAGGDLPRPSAAPIPVGERAL